MIRLHRLNDQELVINAELIEYVEAQGVQTVVGLATGNRLNVKESVDEVIQRCIEYRRSVYVGAAYLPAFLKEGSSQVAVDPLRKK